MRWAGFDASGLDLSPGLTEAARRRFEIPVVVGPLEDQTFEPSSLDVIVLMDVLEHLRNPLRTLALALRILKSDGIFFLQTPCYREGKTLEQMQAENDPFLQHLKPEQHLYLFSRSSIQLFFRNLGITHFSFEPAIFAIYDMAVVAGREALAPLPRERADRTLESRPDGRAVLALLDLDDKLRELDLRHQESEADRAARLESIYELHRHVDYLRRELDERERAIKELTANLQGRDTTIGALENALAESGDVREQARYQQNASEGQLRAFEDESLLKFLLRRFRHQRPRKGHAPRG
jgi:SAM-dependent methyltransferase